MDEGVKNAPIVMPERLFLAAAPRCRFIQK